MKQNIRKKLIIIIMVLLLSMNITLSINAKVKIKKYMINKLLDVTDLTESSQIRIVKKSTAKY